MYKSQFLESVKGVEIWSKENPTSGCKVFIYEGVYRKKAFKKLGICRMYRDKDDNIYEYFAPITDKEASRKTKKNPNGKKGVRLTFLPDLLPELAQAIRTVSEMISGVPMIEGKEEESDEKYKIADELGF